MAVTSKIVKAVANTQELAPAGFVLALHIRFAAPTLMVQTYPKPWVDYYSQNGLVMRDPTVLWGLNNQGTRRWCDLDDPDGLFKVAAGFGLPHGASCAVEHNNSRSLGGFAHRCRDFTHMELAGLERQVLALHLATAGMTEMPPDITAQLSQMGASLVNSAR